jgi:hypothetical protein
MIHVHWNIIVFIVIEMTLLILIAKEISKPRGDYGFDLFSPFLIIAMLCVALIWGGIFWW